MHSCLYHGRVSHRRHAPRPHAFRQRLFMVYLDLDELATAFRGRWLWSTDRPALARFRRSDYLGDAGTPLKQAVLDRVERESGRRPAGPVRLLTHLRCFGYSFNPVSFYYCFDAAGDTVSAVVAEVTNTPWGERHAYVLTPRQGEGARRLRFRQEKALHVSPFMPMDLEYRWRLAIPGERLSVAIQCRRAGAPLFDAALALERRPINTATLAASLARFPVMSAAVIGGIYWQALRLWCKGTPVYRHPAGQAPSASGEAGTP